MYESPIEKIVNYVQSQLVESEESELMTKITQTIGYVIDKDELIRALQYDRQQYKKGYADGVADAKPRWISVDERLPEIHQDVLVSLRSLDVEVGFRAETELGFYCEGDYIELQNVLAWMPLPEPYKMESDEQI